LNKYVTKGANILINYIWAALIVISVISALFTGRISEITSAVYKGGDSAIQLCISMTAIMAVWGGLMRIAEKSGLTNIISKILSPLVGLVFHKLDRKSEAAKAISMNVAANMLGLGNAATPLGIDAMKRLNALNSKSNEADNNMITFVVLNTASIQLVPTTIAALRSKYGAENPMDIAVAIIITSIISLIVGLVINKLIIIITSRKRETH